LQTATSLIGVLGVQLHHDQRIDFSTRQMIEAFALQLALVLEKEHFIQAVSRADMLAHSENLHRTLLDSISHELKTPIAVINAAVEGMDGVASPYLAEITTASQRLQRVVDNLLHMTQLESDVLQPRFDWCDLRDVIAAARQAVGKPLESHPLTLHLPDDLPLVKLDHTLLTQALANILHNAAVYTPEGSGIEVSVKWSADHSLIITLRDHGPGLPHGKEEEIFRLFQRGVLESSVPGAGLGLAIAHNITEAHQGKLLAKNREGGGSCFHMQLPAGIPPALNFRD